MRGRTLSLALLVVGVLLLTVGIAVVTTAGWGAMVGTGVALAFLGGALVAGGLFLVPTDGGRGR